MKIKYLILILILAFATEGFAQTVLLQEKVKDYTALGNKGPNLKRFNYFNFGFGLIVPTNNNQANIMVPSSLFMNLGFRHKTKINNYLAIGTDFNFNYSKYALQQDSKKTVPDSVQHNKQHLDFYKFSLGGYIRINFDKRGDNLGKYLDLGAMVDATFAATNHTKDKVDGYNIVVKNKGMKPYEPFNYSLYTRIGFDRLALTASYRMLSMYKKNYFVDGNELPPLSVGLEVAIY
jgi:hypothetical protein